ncbi:hypothetical protein BDV25DRAFT_158437 [Aspergillus avenaceus]|uniref:Uncharacterized protein n=1 Tax=Aspergillus avenaceus TaxID=36643 RepID=A0A5N6TQH3_ASPAV|nr:hypothetical protein BDV25DRAFT_158437 [Aspergillus avenaceus]
MAQSEPVAAKNIRNPATQRCVHSGKSWDRLSTGRMLGERFWAEIWVFFRKKRFGNERLFLFLFLSFCFPPLAIEVLFLFFPGHVSSRFWG